jgi:serine/threonine protein phosphatase PrpC
MNGQINYSNRKSTKDKRNLTPIKKNINSNRNNNNNPLKRNFTNINNQNNNNLTRRFSFGGLKVKINKNTQNISKDKIRNNSQIKKMKRELSANIRNDIKTKKLFYNIPSRLITLENSSDRSSDNISNLRKIDYSPLLRKTNSLNQIKKNYKKIKKNIPIVSIDLSNKVNKSNIKTQKNNLNNPNLLLKSRMLNRNINSENSKRQSKLKLYQEYFYSENPNKNYREKMEDFHSIIPQLNKNINYSYFSIYDGHSGDQVAIFCKNNLHKILLKNLISSKYKIENSLINSFEQIDKEIKKQNYNNQVGSTATVILIYEENINLKQEKYIACANVGDSKSYIITEDSIKKISKDHNCNNKNEIERIKKKGGIIFNKRVFGTLMLTRSIGDREMKDYGVCPTPSVNIIKILDNFKFCVIASDGVWDVISEEELFCIFKENLSCQELSKKIIDISLEKNSMDNLSCIVIKF